MNRYLYIDFEYNSTNEPDLNLICVAYAVFNGKEEEYRNCYWLWDEFERQQAIEELSSLIGECTIVSWALQAEARSLFTLMPWLRPKDLSNAIDLQLNYKMLVNNNHELQYGRQLIDGKEVKTYPPKRKWEQTEADRGRNNSKPQTNLAAATYKLLGVKIDTDRKTLMRDIIISRDEGAINRHRTEIEEYCLSDINYLPALLESQLSHMRRHAFSRVEIDETWKTMAEYATRSALMEMTGYPVNVEELNNFISNLPEIVKAAAEKVNEENPDVKPFMYSKKDDSYVRKLDRLRRWIAERFTKREWLLTDGGQKRDYSRRDYEDPACNYSLKEDAWRDHFSSSDQNLGGSMVRYLGVQRSLNGFTPKKQKSTFTDYLGSDGRVRAYFNPYGSQTSRTQPKATSFIWLKSKWMRYLVQPRRGRAIIAVDYGSQEFLIAALLSHCDRMIEAYKSGDPYLQFGKDAGMIPQDATKKSHGEERDSFKDTVLGTSYDMSPAGLAKRLTMKGEKKWVEDEAAGLINAFYNTYEEYGDFKDEATKDYYDDGQLRLRDGWTLFGDNDNWRSVRNFLVQGAGAAIMRRAVAYAQDDGIDVISTLHDALYAEFDSRDSTVPTRLGLHMVQAFVDYFPGQDSDAKLIRLDGSCWSYDFDPLPEWGSFFPIKFSQRYVDERGEKDLQHYLRFLEHSKH